MIIILITLICAVAAAILRGFQLTVFNPANGLLPHGDLTTGLLMAFCAAAALGLLAYALLNKNKKSAEKTLGNVWLAMEMAAASALFTASAYEVFKGISKPQVSILCLGALGLLSAVSLLYIALSINTLRFTSATGFWATVPVFWSCYLLVVDFWNHAGNPVRNAYMYGMLAIVLGTLAMYAKAGFFFNRVRRGAALFYTLLGAFFAVLTAGGSLFARFILRPAELAEAALLPVSSYLYMAFIALHLTATAYAILHGRYDPPPQTETQE